MISCKELIMCDAVIANDKISENGKSPTSMIDPSNFDDFKQKLKADKKLNKVFRSLSKIYSDTIQNGFQILSDDFGGFGVFNKTGRDLRPSFTPISFPIGIIEFLPNELKTEISDQSIMRSSRDKREKVLVGTGRFVNHSCAPNTKFFQGFSCILPYPCVRFQVIKKIGKNEEITVNYGPSFFGEGNKDCLCPFKDYHFEKSSDISKSSDDLIESDGETEEYDWTPLQISQQRVVENEPEKTETPLRSFTASLSSSSDNSTGSRKRTSFLQRKRPIKLLEDAGEKSSKILRSFISQAYADSESSPNSIASDRSFVFLPDFNTCDSEIELVSPSVPANQPYSESESESEAKSFTNLEETREEKRLQVSSFELDGEALFDFGPGFLTSVVTVHNAVLSLISLVCEHSGSDDLLFSLLKRERLIHPSSSIPSKDKLKLLISKITNRYIKTIEDFENGQLILIRFFSQLSQIVKANINQIIQYSTLKIENQDIKLEQLKNEKNIRIRIILNTDGAKVLKSCNQSAYPVWAAVADLPPILRSSFKNIILCSIWYGNKEVPWNQMFEHYEEELSQTLFVSYQGAEFEVEFITVMLITDLVCTADVLKMKQYNGFYGCSLCCMRGVHKFGAHAYPHDEVIRLRSPDLHKKCALYYEQGDIQHRSARKEKDTEANTLGVKGYPKIFEIIDNLPLTCPIDSMHQTLKGVAKDMIDFFFGLSGSTTDIDVAIKNFKKPLEFARTVRSLKHRIYFKANELKAFFCI